MARMPPSAKPRVLLVPDDMPASKVAGAVGSVLEGEVLEGTLGALLPHPVVSAAGVVKVWQVEGLAMEAMPVKNLSLLAFRYLRAPQVATRSTHPHPS